MRGMAGQPWTATVEAGKEARVEAIVAEWCPECDGKGLLPK